MKKLKPPAPAPFAIAPWEHDGVQFETMPGATVRVEIGGKRRNLLLKIRGGRIFFKEPSRAQIYATQGRFDDDLTGDALIEKWETAVEADSYGALFIKRDYLARLPMRAQLIFLVRPDGSALVQEHFDEETWFELPQAAITPSLWHSGLVGDAVGLLMGAAHNAVLNRAVTPAQRDRDLAKFVGATPETFALLVRGAVETFVPALQKNRLSFEVELKSGSAFHAGADNSPFGSIPESSPDFGRAWRLLKTHLPFVGLNWHEGAEQNDYYGFQKMERLSRAGREKWGEDWRGNWAPQRALFKLKIKPNASAHEQLESRLALRDFLAALDTPEATELLGKL